MQQTNTKKTLKKKIKKEVVQDLKQAIKAEYGYARKAPKKRKPKRQPKTKLAVSKSDIVNEHGLDQLTQSLFSGVAGIHRGITWGNQTTALCRFKQVVTLTLPLNTYCSIAWAPTQLANANAFVYVNGNAAANTLIVDPYNSTGTAGYTSTSVAGPFNSGSPALEWRVVRAAMRLTPTTSLTATSGSVMAAYIPALYVGPPAAGSLTMAGAAWTQTNMENYAIMKTFSGQQSLMFQWFPDDDEVFVETAAHYAVSDVGNSGFGIILGGGNGAVTYLVELDYGIEYVPVTAYRPYVDKKLPEVNPDAAYYLTHRIQKSWDKLVLATVQEYDAQTALIDHLPSAWSERYQAANVVTTPAVNLPLRLEEEKALGYCDYVTERTGYDVCGGVAATLEKASQGIPSMVQRISNLALSRQPEYNMIGV